ncbi:MAG: hypothetical protein KIG74_06270 [Clostridiaceae bacterium]|nr:hypothetical protein [Clostridiaceae bacterium]
MSNSNRKKTEMGGQTSTNPIMRIIYWFKNYWYYYKIPMLCVLAGVVLLGSILCTVVFKEKTDYTVVIVSQLGVDTEDHERLRQNFESHLTDIDGNGKVKVNLSCIQLDVDLTDEFSVAAYEALTGMLVFDEVVFLIVDDYCARYLQDIQAIEPLSVLGIEGGDDAYKINIMETDLLEGTSVGKYLDYYLVVKKLSDVDSDDARYLARRDAIVPMLAEVLP